MSDNMILPKIIYGTAWKGEATDALVKMAVSAGFLAIDTANQPQHYSESLVGEALLQLNKQGIFRSSLFLQTKFTHVGGHGHRIPYDPAKNIANQVETSFQSSLKHLHTEYVDSYLLHAPYSRNGLDQKDWEAWKAFEEIYETGKAKLIGISNVNIGQLRILERESKIKPMVVQNRCYAKLGWDKDIREFCKSHQIIYQGFSLLTANHEILNNKKIKEIAEHLNKTPEQVILRFATLEGMVPLSGTMSIVHMQQDLQIFEFNLTVEEIAEIEIIGV